MNQLTVISRWKAVARIIFYWVCFVVVYMAGGFISGFFPRNPHLPGAGNWISGTFSAFFITWLFLKWENISFASIGLRWEKDTFIRFSKGFVLGICIFGVMMLILFIGSGAQLHRNPWRGDCDILIAYLTIIPLGIMEEVAFRSYSLIRLNRVFGVRVTLLIIAIAFALYHMSMGWSVYVAFSGPFVWSFVFGLAALRSKGIALPAGVHIAVNMFQNAIGLHTDKAFSWTISFPANHLPGPELTGLFSQLLLLSGSLIAMEIFLRQSNGKSSIATGF